MAKLVHEQRVVEAGIDRADAQNHPAKGNAAPYRVLAHHFHHDDTVKGLD